MKKYLFKKNLAYLFMNIFLFIILMNVVVITMYLAAPEVSTYKVIIFDRALLMLENVVCAFSFTVAFGLIINYEERKIKKSNQRS